MNKCSFFVCDTRIIAVLANMVGAKKKKSTVPVSLGMFSQCRILESLHGYKQKSDRKPSPKWIRRVLFKGPLMHSNNCFRVFT